MKSSLALPTAAILLAGLLAGCGQTGPLYMPNPPAKPAPAQAQAQAQVQAELPPQPVTTNNATTPAPTK